MLMELTSASAGRFEIFSVLVDIKPTKRARSPLLGSSSGFSNYPIYAQNPCAPLLEIAEGVVCCLPSLRKYFAIASGAKKSAWHPYVESSCSAGLQAGTSRFKHMPA